MATARRRFMLPIMRVAILHYTKPPVIGGVERVVGEQALALRALGHEVEILTRADWKGGDWDIVLVHNVFTMPFDLEWTRMLWETAAAHPEMHWVNWVHDVAAANLAYAGLDWSADDMGLLTRCPPNCRHVAVSEVRRDAYCRVTGLAKAGCLVIPNGVDPAAILGLTERLRATADAWELWRRDWVLFHPTRLLRRKNLEMGVRVLARLVGRGSDAVYLVSGAPDPHQADGARYAEKICALAREEGVADRLVFLGRDQPLSDEEVRGCYLLSDVLFFPSREEGYGLPLVEAEALGLPTYASDIAAHRETGVEGVRYFVLDDSPSDLAAGIEADEELRHRARRRRRLGGRRWDGVLARFMASMEKEP